MFKASTVTILVIIAGHVQAQAINLDLYLKDKRIGTAKYKETWRHGERTSVFEITGWDEEGAKIEITQSKTIDSRGFPIREEETIKSGSGRKAQDVVLTVRYDDTGAALLKEFRNKNNFTTERSYVPPPGYSRADVSDLWFSRTRPVPGTTVSSTIFDIEHARWQVVETTYTGRKSIIVGGRQLMLNEVVDVRDNNTRMVYLDDKGLPVLMKNGQSRTEKHF